jgi:hypothetical protein
MHEASNLFVLYMRHIIYYYRWHELHRSKILFQYLYCLFKIKSSSTWLIPASLCEGPFFYFYVESSSSKFMHQLREHSCHSECNVHSPRIIIDWLILLVLLVLKLLVSSHPLNSKGVLAFMFCSTIGDKLNTTFLCFICSNKHVLSMLSIHCHCLSYFSWLEHSC